MQAVARTNAAALGAASPSPPFTGFIFSPVQLVMVRWDRAAPTDTALGHRLPRGQAVAKTPSHAEFLFSLI